MAAKPHAPDAPMIVQGSVLPGDARLMLRCMIEELLRGGASPRELERMARDANYQALYAARETLGDAAFRAALATAVGRVGVHTCRVRETPATMLEATLTVQGQALPARSPS